MSYLQHFAAVPQRAIGDRRLRERDLRVLMAICRAVDAKSGIATISQGRVGKWAGCARQKANASAKVLVELGYIEKVGLRRAQSGAGGYIRYRVCYAEPVGHAAEGNPVPAAKTDVTPADDAVGVTRMDADSVSQAGVTESRPDHISIDKKSSPEKPTPSEREDGTDLWRSERQRILDNFRKTFGGGGNG